MTELVNFTENRQRQPVYINQMRDPVDHLISSHPAAPRPEEHDQGGDGDHVSAPGAVRGGEDAVHTNKTEQLGFRQSWSPTYLYPRLLQAGQPYSPADCKE